MATTVALHISVPVQEAVGLKEDKNTVTGQERQPLNCLWRHRHQGVGTFNVRRSTRNTHDISEKKYTGTPIAAFGLEQDSCLRG